MRNIALFFVSALVVCLLQYEVKAQVVINEILASNTSTNISELDKNFQDWIELYNMGNTEESIGNWFLTDDKTKPTKWEIPFYYSVPPKSYKLFWLDNLNTSNHTNFKLSAKGETIYLFNKDSILVDSIKAPFQYPDITYGRVSDSLNILKYLKEPTPLERNSNRGFEIVEFSEKPIFSKSSGFYKDAFSLELSTQDDSYKIYYTLDGSEPNQRSNIYNGPINIVKSTVVRAKTYSDDKITGKSTTRTYLINESFTLPVFSLAINPDYLWDKEIGFYVKGISGTELEWESTEYSDLWEPANYFQEWERPINIEFFDNHQKAHFNINAGARIHGRSSRTYSQKSLAIFLREKYGTTEISTKFFGEKSPEVIRSFLLRNGGNDWGMIMFLDGLVHTLVNDKIDIDAQLYQPAIVFLNGEYWGIHNIREKINENYIRTKYPKDSAELDIIETDGLTKKLVASSGSFDEYNKMKAFIDSNKLSIQENYETVCKWIDVNEFINYLITEVYICNGDWPQSNMKMWKYSNDSSKWRWILYDTEYSFRESSKYAHFNIFEHLFAINSEYYNTTPCSNYLIRKLFENEDFKNEFIQRTAIYLYTIFDSHRVLSVLDSLKSNIEPEIERNFKKWGGIKQQTFPNLVTCSNNAEWEANISYVRDFINNRPGILRKNMIEYFELKDTLKLKLKVNDMEAGKVSLMNYKLDKSSFEGYIFADIPIQLEAIPNEGYEFVEWKGIDCDRRCTINLSRNKKITAIFRKVE